MKYGILALLSAATIFFAAALYLPSETTIIWHADNSTLGNHYWNKRTDVLLTPDNPSIPSQVPGPNDKWAGGESKTLTIKMPSSRATQLLLSLYDSHHADPPVLLVTSGDRKIGEIKIRPGNGESWRYWKRKGKSTNYVIKIPAGAGSGEGLDIKMKTVSGSWMAVASLIAYQEAPFWHVWSYIPHRWAKTLLWLAAIGLAGYVTLLVIGIDRLWSRETAFTIIALVGAPLIFIMIIEGSLALFNIADPAKAEDPYSGFNKYIDMLVENQRDSEFLVTNHQRSKLNQTIAKIKPKNEYRVFFFGGSNVYFLQPQLHLFQRMLESYYPDNKIKIINFGMPAYGTTRIVPLVKEAVRYQPDLMIIYSGHNEFLERRFYEDLLKENPILTKLRVFLHKFRFYQLARNLYRKMKSTSIGLHTEKAKIEFETGRVKLGKPTADIDWIREIAIDYGKYTDINFHRQTLERYENNLNSMVKIAEKNGTPLLIGTLSSPDLIPPRAPCYDFELGLEKWVKVNELADRITDHIVKNKNLFDSLIGRDVDYGKANEVIAEIRPALEEAKSILPENAGVQYWEGYFKYFQKDFEGAKPLLENSETGDCTPYRASPLINNIVRNVAMENGLTLVHVNRLIHEHSPFGISYKDERTRETWHHGSINTKPEMPDGFDPDLKRGLFYDHVHLNQAGKYLMLKLMADTIFEKKLLER